MAHVPRIECRGLGKRLASGSRMLTILDEVDLAVEPGEFVAVRGPSGSGKSTLLGLLAGLDRPSAGEVLLQGHSLNGLSEDELADLRRQHVGFVFQAFQLLGNLTAHENVGLPLELLGVRDAQARAEALLARVGLAERAHHYPSQLSGGEQQRVALARAFAPRPKILFADEPTGNLDAATGESILALFGELRAETDASIVLVTHDEAVAALADRTIHLERGRVVATSDAGRSEPVATPADAG